MSYQSDLESSNLWW